MELAAPNTTSPFSHARPWAQALLYCATPASVFHSCVYTESPFALATFGGLLLLHDGFRALSACAFAAGTCLRSNGVVNAGYLLFDALCRSARRFQESPSYRSHGTSGPEPPPRRRRRK